MRARARIELDLDHVCGAHRDTVLQVDPAMLELFPDYPALFPVRVKTILLFQVGQNNNPPGVCCDHVSSSTFL